MSKRKIVVGRSSRTPVKHMILDKMVGKINGVLSLSSPKVPCRANPFLIIDLCGGDGLVTVEHDASPQILHKHCIWLRERGKRADLIVFEEKAITFELLQENLAGMLGIGDWFSIRHQDSRLFCMPQLQDNQAVFIHCDPNCVDQIPLAKPFVESWNKYTTYLVTLGCNAAGVKMNLTLERRSIWFEYIQQLCDVLPANHDAVLFWLKRDKAQWAYLLSIPHCWSREFALDIINKAELWWPDGVGFASWRDQQPEFIANINRLFLTRKEYNATYND